MKLIINISDKAYELLRSKSELDNIAESIIANGKPLPKGHGRLIDADAYQTKLEEKAKRLKNIDTINGLCGAVALLSDTETIIEADKGDIEE